MSRPIGEYFTIQKYDIRKAAKEKSDKERFYLFTCVDGKGTIKYKDGEEKICMGDSIFIPACLGEYELFGECTLLKSYVPDSKREEDSILNIIRK